MEQLRCGLLAGRLLIPDLVVADAPAAAEAGVTLSVHDIVVAIEIASPTTRVTDKKMKPLLYAAVGIAHYWRLEPAPASATSRAALHRPPRPGWRANRPHRAVPPRPRPRRTAPVTRGSARRRPAPS
ncbi:Uma2 family endonuclease, partial [Kitasatospora sp. P5_F3]